MVWSLLLRTYGKYTHGFKTGTWILCKVVGDAYNVYIKLSRSKVKGFLLIFECQRGRVFKSSSSTTQLPCLVRTLTALPQLCQ